MKLYCLDAAFLGFLEPFLILSDYTHICAKKYLSFIFIKFYATYY